MAALQLSDRPSIRRVRTSRAGPQDRGPSRCATVTRATSTERYSSEKAPDVRVLVAFDDTYRSYRESISFAISKMRSGTHVVAVSASALDAEISRLSPHVVICGGGATVPSGDETMRVILPTEEQNLARVSVDGASREIPNPSLIDLLVLLDEAMDLIRVSRQAP